MTPDAFGPATRLTVCQMALADPISGEFVRDFLRICESERVCEGKPGSRDLVDCLIEVRQACGFQGAGHA